MKKIYIPIVFATVMLSNAANAQTNKFPATGAVGIGTTTPNTSSLLEIKSTTKGLLMSRMTKAQRDAIITPSTGLLIYQTNSTPGFYYYNGSLWKAVTPVSGASNGWSLTGNAGTSATNFLGTTDNTSLRFKTKNVQRVIIDSIGNVGIGTTTPASKLEVHDGNIKITNTTTSANLIINANASVASASNQIVFQDDKITKWALGGANIGSAPGNNFSLYNYNLNDNALTVSTSTNNVGIGTTSPGSRLEVVASSGNGISGTSTGTNSTSYGVYGSNPNNVGVLGNGKIGSYGNGDQYGMYGFSNDSIGVAGITNGTSDNSYGIFGYSPNSTGVYGNGQFGVVGIGKNTGVSGIGNGDGVYASGDYGVRGFGASVGVLGASSNYAGYFSGNVYASGIYQSSDISLKQNIRNFSSAMGIINKLHPTQYEFRQDGNYKLMNLPAGSHYGLIAQEMEKVLPNLIKQTKFDPAMATPNRSGIDGKTNTQQNTKQDVINFKALNYTELIPIMIKGMQELSQQNDSLKRKSIMQEKINADLQNQIDELKTMIVSNQISVAGQQSMVASSTSLQQNIPNPFTNTTSIGYTLPQKFINAQIVITDKNGKTIKAINISGNEKGNVIVDASTLSSGAYQYSLIVDGKLIATKQMVLAK